MQNTVNARLKEINSRYPCLEVVNVVSPKGEVVVFSFPGQGCNVVQRSTSCFRCAEDAGPGNLRQH